MRNKISRFLKILLSAFGVCALLILLYTLDFGVLKRLDNNIYDAFTQLNAKGAKTAVPIIIDIDEKSLKELGQWPWPRYILSQIIVNLTNAGVSAIGLDILQSEQDRSSPALIKAELERIFGVGFDISALPEELRDNDKNFIDVLKQTPVVLGSFAFFDEEQGKNEKLPKPLSIATKVEQGAKEPSEQILEASSFLLPLDEFFEAAPVGVINTHFAGDGVIRSVPLLIKTQDKIYASLALRVLMLALNKRTLRINSDIDGIKSIKIGDVEFHPNSDGSINPVYAGKGRTYKYYSAVDILNGSVSPDELAGKIAFIGSSANGLFDIRNTPVDPLMPGAELHATIIDNMLNDKSITTPPWSLGAQVLSIILLSVFGILVFGYANVLVILPVSCVVIAGIFYVSKSFFDNGLFITPVPALLAFGLLAALLLLFRFYQAEMAKRQIKTAFSRYLSPHLISQIEDTNELYAGEQKEISVLFTDIRGFTNISEKLAPSQMVSLLNFYFAPMTKCVKDNDGTMDKFIGDALMAFWNAPLDTPNHAKKALNAALAMQDKLSELKDEIIKRFGVEIRIGAGINTGLVHVGNMGSAELLDYTCIGDNVNLASRLEGLCKYYGVNIILSEFSARQISDIEFFKLDKIRVKGKNEAVEIFAPLSKAGSKWKKAWQNALSLYEKGEFNAALLAFKELLAEFSEYKTCCELFAKRCQKLLENPPTNWDGVWAFESK